MDHFDTAIVVILAHEGGWVNNPNDPGGETAFGISMRWIQQQGLSAAELGIDGFYPGCLHKLTVDTAKKLYRKYFWDANGYGSLTHANVATKVFDCCVNAGPKRAALLAQQAANGMGSHLTVDGSLGPKSIAAINALDSQAYVNMYCDYMLHFYQGLVASNPKLSVFLKAWTNRAGWGRG